MSARILDHRAQLLRARVKSEIDLIGRQKNVWVFIGVKTRPLEAGTRGGTRRATAQAADDGGIARYYPRRMRKTSVHGAGRAIDTHHRRGHGLRERVGDRCPATPDLIQPFQELAAYSFAHLDEITRSENARTPLPESLVRSYLSENIDFSFGEKNCEGLRRFYALAHEVGLTNGARPLEFIG